MKNLQIIGFYEINEIRLKFFEHDSWKQDDVAHNHRQEGETSKDEIRAFEEPEQDCVKAPTIYNKKNCLM